MSQEGKTTLELLNTKSILELKDLLARQDNILKNAAFVAKLKDKGAKLHLAREKIQTALNEALSKQLENPTSIEPKMHLKSEEFEWTINSMANMNLNSSESDSQVQNLSSKSARHGESVGGAADILGSESVANSLQSAKTSNIIRFPHPPDNLAVQRHKFKPSHLLNEGPSTSEKFKTDAQVEKQLRWDEALLPPSSSKSVKQLDWHDSFQELCSHKLRQKEEQAGESSVGKSKSYAYEQLPSSSLNLSILTKNVYDLLDDGEIEDDCDKEDLEQDHISEESETEEA